MHPELPTSVMITRRRFNASATRMGAAAILGGSTLTAAAASTARADVILKVGVIGCGGRGTGAAVQALLADERAVLWAAGDLFPEQIEPCLRRVGAAISENEDDPASLISQKIQTHGRAFSGFDNHLKVIDSGVDVVLLTTPPAFRPEHLRASVEARKHVFCEKPVAVDAPGVRSVLESAGIAKERGLSLMTGFCWRYHDQVKETIERVQQGGIGEIRTIQTTYNTTGWIEPKPRQPGWSDAEFMVRNWHYFHTVSGDHLVEQAVHALDWQAWVMQDQAPLRCWAVGGRQTRPDVPETGNVYDNFAITYEYPDGIRAYHMCRHWPNTPSDNSALFIGSEGICTMQPWQQNHSIVGTHPWRGNASGNDMYQREHDVLFQAIRSNQPVNEGIPMAGSTLLAIMGRMAAYTGQVVTWEQALNSTEALNPLPWSFGERTIPTMAIPGRSKLS